MRRLLAFAPVLASLACSPTPRTARATSTPVAAAPATSVAEASARPEPDAPSPTTGALTKIVGETAIDVGGGRSLRIAADGSVSLGATQLTYASVGTTKFYERVPLGDDTVVIIGIADDAKPSDPGYLLAMRIDGHADRAVWKAFVKPARPFDPSVLGWRTLAADGRLVIVQHERVLCIDATTGREIWTFEEDEPGLLTESILMGELLMGRPHLRMGDAAVVDNRVVVDTTRADDTGASKMPEPRRVELDLATGWRVHVETTRVPRTPRPLFAFTRKMELKVTYDDPPAPQPDPPPPDLDGVVIGQAALMWNTKTGHGVIVNPGADDVPEVVAFARDHRIVGGRAAGKPVTWLGVIDTYAVAESVLGGTSRPKGAASSQGADLVRLQYLFATLGTGTRVDIDPVATPLGVPAVRRRADLPRAVKLRVVAEPGDGRSIELAWDRMRFADSNWRVGQSATDILE